MDQTTDHPEPGPSPELRQALDRLYALEDEAREKHRLVLGLQDEINELRRALRAATDELSALRRNPKRSERREQELEAKLRARKRELERKTARSGELGEQMQAARRLADNCRAWLESGGASIESLEAGIPVPRRHGLAPTPESKAAEGRRAASATFGSGGF